MKTPDHRFRKVIIVLAVNLMISWLTGYILKDFLIKILSPQIYYQLIVFISLMIAPSVGLLYTKHIHKRIKTKEDELKGKLNIETINNLKGDEKKYAESLMKPNVDVEETLRALKAEREAFEKSK